MSNRGDGRASVRHGMRPVALGGTGRGAPTLEMVAAAAGVSRSTVSRVVNGSPKVRPDVVDAVNATIARMNYVPNRAARSLASRQTEASRCWCRRRRRASSVIRTSPPSSKASRRDSKRPTTSSICWSRARTRPARPVGICAAAASTAPWWSPTTPPTRTCRSSTEAMPVVFGGRPAARRIRHYVDVDNLAGARRATSLPGRTRSPTDRDHHRTAGHACLHRPTGRLAAGDGRQRPVL